MEIVLSFVTATAIAFLLSGCASPEFVPTGVVSIYHDEYFIDIEKRSKAPGVEKSWENAVIYLPNTVFPKRPKDLEKSDLKYPVVLYLHGCFGISYRHDNVWAKIINDIGFAVVIPDSFARPGRKSNCSYEAKRQVAGFIQAPRYRAQEIALAVEKLKQLDWVDQNRVFIMGHSEGGQATAKSPYDYFKGAIISGWTCTVAGHPEQDGIDIPKETPILVIVTRNDEWLTHPALNVEWDGKRNCAYRGDNHKKLTYFELPGTSHTTLDFQEFREAVKDFLIKNSK